MKQTTVEWLEDQYIKHSSNLLEMRKAFEQAKAMEKEQIIQAYYQNGWNDNDNEHNAEQYYNETFNKTIATIVPIAMAIVDCVK